MGTGAAPKYFQPPQAFGTSAANGGGTNTLQQAQAAAPIPQATFLPLNQPTQPAQPAPPPDQSVQPADYSQDPITQAMLRSRQYAGSYGRMQELEY